MTRPNLFLHSAKVLSRKLRATVHKSLKLGFTTDTADALKIKEGMGVLLYTETEIPMENRIYLRLVSVKTDEAFRINKAGSYYYAATKPFFEKLGRDLGIDFATTSISYEMEEVEIDGELYYLLTPRGKEQEETGEEF